MAYIRNRFEPSPLANLQRLNGRSDLHNHTGPFVARTTGAEGRHGRHGPVVHHEVDVGHAEPGDIELDEDFCRAGDWNGDIFNFLLGQEGVNFICKGYLDARAFPGI